MKKKYTPKYPLVWQKDDLYLEIYCSIPNIATGIVMTTNTALFVIDPGDGILRDLNKNFNKDEILSISEIFISHGHHDHVGGLWSLLTYLSVMKKKSPITIFYPKGGKEIFSIYKAFVDVYSKELTYKIKLKEINNSITFRRKKISIKPFEVDHRELTDDGSGSVKVPSLGFKFSYEGKSICYGGDTTYCENIVKMADGVDLAIIEAGAENEDDKTHMTIEQAEAIGQSAKEYFLVHVPG